MKEAHTKQPHAPASINEQSIDLPGKKRPIGKILLIILAVLLLIAASAYLGYWYRGKKAKTDLDKVNQQITELQTQKKNAEDNVTKIQKELDELKATKSIPAPTTSNVPTTAVKENVIASITSGNTAALEGYMANPVHVIIAASGGVGDKTPAQAVESINYVDAGTDPWNFSLSAATFSAYRSGPYGQYFPANAVVGKSANNYVIAFSFNSAGKISTVFMAVNADLLTN